MTDADAFSPDRNTDDRSEGGGRVPSHDEPRAPVCEICGGPIEERHCKVVCLNCGYQRDCSDP